MTEEPFEHHLETFSYIRLTQVCTIAGERASNFCMRACECVLICACDHVFLNIDLAFFFTLKSPSFCTYNIFIAPLGVICPRNKWRDLIVVVFDLYLTLFS